MPTVTDLIVLDCNVFQHLGRLDPQFNPDGHVETLLRKLIGDRTKLCVDSKRLIRKEYNTLIIPIIQNSSQTGSQLEILRYWMNMDNQLVVAIDPRSPLMVAIERVILGNNQKEDRAYVAVAFARGRILVTNDKHDIIEGPDHERKYGLRRNRVLKETKKYREKGSAILMTSEAHLHFCLTETDDEPCQSPPEASTS